MYENKNNRQWGYGSGRTDLEENNLSPQERWYKETSDSFSSVGTNECLLQS